MDQRQKILNLSGAMVAVTILGTMAFIAWALVYREIPKGNETTLVQFVGALQALAGLIVGFYFGSSHTSKQQAETIDHMSRAANAPQMVVEKASKANVTIEGSPDVASDQRNP